MKKRNWLFFEHTHYFVLDDLADTSGTAQEFSLDLYKTIHFILQYWSRG